MHFQFLQNLLLSLISIFLYCSEINFFCCLISGTRTIKDRSMYDKSGFHVFSFTVLPHHSADINSIFNLINRHTANITNFFPYSQGHYSGIQALTPLPIHGIVLLFLYHQPELQLQHPVSVNEYLQAVHFAKMHQNVHLLLI